MPTIQRAQIAGNLDMVRHSTRAFAIALDSGEMVGGVVVGDLDVAKLGPWLGRRVLVSGVVDYEDSGRILRIEADHVEPADGEHLG